MDFHVMGFWNLFKEPTRQARPMGLAAVNNLQSTIGDVHRDFKAKAHVDSGWFFPCHTVTPSGYCRKLRSTHWQRICQHRCQYWASG
jgi:hypothetical protein